MNRRLLIAVLGTTTILGFGSGFARLFAWHHDGHWAAHHHRDWDCDRNRDRDRDRDRDREGRDLLGSSS